jgi:hypothetical protein
VPISMVGVAAEISCEAKKIGKSGATGFILREA